MCGTLIDYLEVLPLLTRAGAGIAGMLIDHPPSLVTCSVVDSGDVVILRSSTVCPVSSLSVAMTFICGKVFLSHPGRRVFDSILN